MTILQELFPIPKYRKQFNNKQTSIKGQFGIFLLCFGDEISTMKVLFGMKKVFKPLRLQISHWCPGIAKTVSYINQYVQIQFKQQVQVHNPVGNMDYPDVWLDFT